MRKEYFIIIFVLLIASVTFFIIVSNKTPTQPSPSNLEECQTLNYNGEDKINLVFFSEESTAKKYSDFFLEIEPFDKNKNQFNFYYINYKPECELYEGIALLCHSEDIIKKAASCPNDYIIAIEKQPSKIRSSAFGNIMSLNSRHSLTVLMHEFGHTFANFAEEYITNQNLPKKSKNCVTNCEKFEGIEDGCYEGCTKESYFRSIKNGIMKTLSSKDYGTFNKKIIQDKINKDAPTITGHAIQEPRDCSEEKYYLIEGLYSQEQINIIKKTIEPGCVGGNGAGEFNYNLILEDNSTILTGEFNPELIFTDMQEESQTTITGETFISNKPFFLKIPIIKKSKTLEITKDNQTLSQINLKDIGNRPCKK